MMPTLNLIDRVLAMGRRYQEVGRHRDAVTVLTRLSHFRELPAEAAEEAQARLGEIHLKRRKYTCARRHLTAALRHQPSNARYHYLLAIAFQADERGDQERAAEHYRRALEFDPGHIKCLADYGLLLLRLGRAADGIARLREAVDRAPEDVEVLGKLVKGLRLSGRGDEARSVLQIALFRHARSLRFRKLWNEYRFQRARRRRDGERMRGGKNAADARQPMILPFIRLQRDNPAGDDRPIIARRDEAEPIGPPHLSRRTRRADHRNVQ